MIIVYSLLSKAEHGADLPEMRFSRRHTGHCLVVSMLVRIIENFKGRRLQFLCDLRTVRTSTQTIIVCLSIHTFCLIASSIGVIEVVMLENGLLAADVMTRRNIRL
jgi:hypothetical protein